MSAYSFSTPAALDRIETILALIGKNPGLPASQIAIGCHMATTTVNLYLAQLAKTGQAHSAKPTRGKGPRWYAGPSPGITIAARRQAKDERIVNCVLAKDCAPVAIVDPFRAFLFGGR